MRFPCNSGELDAARMIYFIVDEQAEAVKIGYTRTAPKMRLSACQIGNPHELHLAAVIPGSWADEQALHQVLRTCHLRGEWFRLCGPVEQMIRAAVELSLTNYIYTS
jgi:hypothetical protein